MKGTGHNEGIRISGGRIEAGALAVGRGAQLSNAEELKESTQLIAEELIKDRPNKTTLTGVLAGITQSVKSVAGLATAAEALTHAVQLFL
jgi:hypothetical protein